MAYFATAYTIHFDDTMAYGSHHFLTAFKFQCAARESFLFGERIYDIDEVRVALDEIHLITADAYSRNLSPARLGDRVAILLTLEEWGRASARFCYRVIDAGGQPVCAGFQTLICVDAKTGLPIPLPTPLQQAMDAMHEIEEPPALESFRDCVLAGGGKVASLFGPVERETAVNYLSHRHPTPDVIAPPQALPEVQPVHNLQALPQSDATPFHNLPVSVPPKDVIENTREAWVFSGQGTFDAELLSQRVVDYQAAWDEGRSHLDQVMEITHACLGGDVAGLVSGIADRSAQAVQETHSLSQVAIHLQNVLGADLRQRAGHRATFLLGHSFGEIAALCVGAKYDLMTGVRIVCERVRSILQHRPADGGLLVVSASRQQVATEAALLGLPEVAIAGRNHERQTVVSGPQRQLTRLREHLQTLAISTVAIASPTSFHHPSLQTAAAAWGEQLQKLQLTAPQTPVYSCIGRRFLTPNDDLAITLASHLLRPFDLQGGLLDIMAAGANMLVDCGSTGSLARILTKAAPTGMVMCAAQMAQPSHEATQTTLTTKNPLRAPEPRLPAPQPPSAHALPAAAPQTRLRGLPAETPKATEVASSRISPRPAEIATTEKPQRRPQPKTEPQAKLPHSPHRESWPAEPTRSIPLPDEFDRSEPRRNKMLTKPSESNRLQEPQAATQNAPQMRLAETAKRPAIAIVGQGCILPGGAATPEQLFTAIHEQRTGIVDQRQFDPHWAEDFYSAELIADRTNSPLVGRVDERDLRAPQGISSEIFESFSRTQQLLCIALAPCLPALESATRVCCLIGATADGFENQDWSSSLRYAGIDPLNPEIAVRGIQSKYATAPSQPAGDRHQTPHTAIQEVFDQIARPGLEVTIIDAACASSLYAVALGMRALEMESADVVIAGGVFCPGPGNSCLFSQFRGLTSTGCRPFDAKSDGVVFSEGAALIALSRVADAKAHNLPTSMIVRGAGLSSDGRSSSANVPQTAGQLLSLQRCYRDYGIDPTTIQAIEGHGTSTPVGDSTEVETLRRFFCETSESPIPLHSLKGLLGHAGWAAGTASIIATSEYLRQGYFPAQAGHCQPSPALAKAQETLVIPSQPRRLPAGRRRIAIDGFGFGGANAHVVLEHSSTDPQSSQHEASLPGDDLPAASTSTTSDKLVLVAYHELLPSLSVGGHRQFDRQATTVPAHHVLLPDLADDMDISQTLAITLVDALARKIPQFASDWSAETAVVLAQSGKTDRGVEATLRVLKNRLQRNLSGLDGHLATLNDAIAETRPSGPYTLQCMMPNVSAGRAALTLDLHGPNFVVDAGPNSLQAAMRSAALLLAGGKDCGTKLALVAAIHANAKQVAKPLQTPVEDELAAIFAVTTEHQAAELGVEVIGELESLMNITEGPTAGRSNTSITQPARELLDALAAEHSTPAVSLPSTRKASTTETEFPLHVPVWAEVSSTPSRDCAALELPVALVVAPADRTHLTELIAALPHCTRRFLIAVVGATARQEADYFENDHVLAFDPDCEATSEAMLTRVDTLAPDVVVGITGITSWAFEDVLKSVNDDNDLCEALFVIAQQLVDQLKQGGVELWGLYPNGWQGMAHPESGKVAGMLKAIQREFPDSRTGVICARQASVREMLENLTRERNQHRHEAEVVYDRGQRLARRLRALPDDIDTQPLASLNSQSVVIATGGARGVTAVLIEALLRDHACNVIAIGRSELEAGPQLSSDDEAERAFYDRYTREHPDATPVQMRESYHKTCARWEAHATLERLNRLGGSVKYVTADVTNRQAMAGVVREIAQEFGRVDLLLHGAGVQYSKRLEHRSLDEFRRTLDVKLGGLRHIVDACREQFGTTVNTHVLTSAYSVFGNDGQHDYGAANETLDRLCNLCAAQQDQPWSSIAWLAWDGVGMTRGSEYRALARQRELSGLKPEDGQFLFRQVIAGKTNSAVNVPMSRSEHVSYEVKTIPSSSSEAKHTTGTTASPGGRVMEIAVELSSLACLPFHRVRQTPTLPGAWILDRMVQTGIQLSQADLQCGDTVTIEDVFFRRFVRYTGNREPQMRVVAEETAGGIQVWMLGDLYHPSGVAITRDHVFAEAKLNFANHAKTRASSLPDAEVVKQSEACFVNDPYCDGCHEDVQLSGPFDCVRDIAISPLGRTARIETDPTCEWPTTIPAMLLDAAWRVGAMYANPEQDELYVPLRIAQLQLPVLENARLLAATQWEIRTTAPMIANGNVRWERTEVVNEVGDIKLCVTNTLATRLR